MPRREALALAGLLYITISHSLYARQPMHLLAIPTPASPVTTGRSSLIPFYFSESKRNRYKYFFPITRHCGQRACVYGGGSVVCNFAQLHENRSETREAALATGWNTFSSAIKSAYSARKTALSDAYSKTTLLKSRWP